MWLLLGMGTLCLARRGGVAMPGCQLVLPLLHEQERAAT